MAFHLTWVVFFGLLGNVISFMVCLAPLPTFYQIWKKKSSEGYQSIPYVIALFSAMLWLFYALFKSDTILLITINCFAFVMEVFYIIFFLFYATKKGRMDALKLVFIFNVLGFGITSFTALFLIRKEMRADVLGWVCMVFSLAVFVAPLCILKKVIKTKSVEYMPFSLSFFLTLNAVAWFFYGYLKKDRYVAIPNILGFTFGVIQMVLYAIYRKPKNVAADSKIHQMSEFVLDVNKLADSNAPDNEAVVKESVVCDVCKCSLKEAS